MMNVRRNPKPKRRTVMLPKLAIASPPVRPPIVAYSRSADEGAARQRISALQMKQAADFA
jgi:hypothetical protein